jgi:hypothetical protein
MNKLFYIIYNSYYKHGEYKNDNPSLTVWGIFLIFFFSISLDIVIITKLINDPLFLHFQKPSKPFILLGLVLFGALVYFLFFHNKRYYEIYETYKENIFLNKKSTKYWGFFIVFFIIVSPLIIGLVRNKIYFNYWV